MHVDHQCIQGQGLWVLGNPLHHKLAAARRPPPDTATRTFRVAAGHFPAYFQGQHSVLLCTAERRGRPVPVATPSIFVISLCLLLRVMKKPNTSDWRQTRFWPTRAGKGGEARRCPGGALPA